uniref:PRA1 family protein n=1 Tax=Rhipicephalus appendiculatus TaxID=34631 RepID=A0A131YN06_RHIAP
MDREQGDVGWSLKSSGDAPDTARAPTPAFPRKRLSSSSKEQGFDFRGAVMTWSSEQLNRVQPWKNFADTTKFSIPKSAQEMTNRIRSNADHFRTNYGIIFLLILAVYVMSSVQLLVSVALVVAVGAALKLHEDDDIAAMWGTRIMLSKNERLAAMTFVALLLLYATDFWSAIMWSIRVVVVIGITHATLYTGLSSSVKSARKLPDIPEEADIVGHL